MVNSVAHIFHSMIVTPTTRPTVLGIDLITHRLVPMQASQVVCIVAHEKRESLKGTCKNQWPKYMFYIVTCRSGHWSYSLLLRLPRLFVVANNRRESLEDKVTCKKPVSMETYWVACTASNRTWAMYEKTQHSVKFPGPQHFPNPLCMPHT